MMYVMLAVVIMKIPKQVDSTSEYLITMQILKLYGTSHLHVVFMITILSRVSISNRTNKMFTVILLPDWNSIVKMANKKTSNAFEHFVCLVLT